MNHLATTRIPFAGALILAALCLAPLAARADVIDHLTGSSSQGAGSVTYTANADTERDDLALTAPLQVGLTVIKQYARSRYILLDPKLKIYASLPMDTAPLDITGVPNLLRLLAPGAASSPLQTITTNVDIQVKDLGPAAAPDVPNVAAHHYSLAIASNGGPPLRIELYSDPRLPRPSDVPATPAFKTVNFPNGDKVRYVLTGDLALYDQAVRYLPVEYIGLPQAGAASAPLVQKSATATPPQVKLDPALFTVPADAKLLSISDFVTAEQNAFLDAISGPQPKLPPASPSPAPGK